MAPWLSSEPKQRAAGLCRAGREGREWGERAGPPGRLSWKRSGPHSRQEGWEGECARRRGRASQHQRPALQLQPGHQPQESGSPSGEATPDLGRGHRSLGFHSLPSPSRLRNVSSSQGLAVLGSHTWGVG